MTSYFEALKHYADFTGRASRKQFFTYAAFLTVILVVSTVVDRLTTHSDKISVVFILAATLHAVPSLAIAIRRLHDSDTSGWFLLIAVIPYLGPLLLFFWAFIEPSPGTNQYGEKPIPVEVSGPSDSPTFEAQMRAWGARLAATLRYLSSLTAPGLRPHPGSWTPAPTTSPSGENQRAGLAGVDESPSAPPPAVKATDRRVRLEALRSKGMLSEAEYLRLLKKMR